MISPEAKQARILIMEMTFIDDEISIEKARERGHVHLYEFCKIHIQLQL